MTHASFGPCPHCKAPLVYLEGAAGSRMDPQCPRCRAVVMVKRATFLMADHSRAASGPKTPNAR
jgi:Zn-finger nucleic acid-binding protein